MPELNAIGNYAREMVPRLLIELVSPGIQGRQHVFEIGRPIASAQIFEFRPGLELEAHAGEMDVFAREQTGKPETGLPGHSITRNGLFNDTSSTGLLCHALYKTSTASGSDWIRFRKYQKLESNRCHLRLTSSGPTPSGHLTFQYPHRKATRWLIA